MVPNRNTRRVGEGVVYLCGVMFHVMIRKTVKEVGPESKALQWRRHDMGALLLLLAVLFAAHLRILNYVTGEDPLTYTRLALDLLDARFGGSAWVDLAGFIMPGYPAILALVIAVAGPVAVPWVNVFFMGAAFSMLYALYKRWGLTPGAGLVAGLTAIALILQAYPINAHFLFYAFRGAAHFFFIVAAFVLAQRADPAMPRSVGWLTMATIVLLVGATVRETALLAWPGLLVWIWLHPRWRGQRMRGVWWLAAPLLAVLAVLAVLWVVGLFEGNIQVRSWINQLLDDGLVGYGFRLLAYLHLLGTGMNWFGAALCVLAVWYCRRCPHVLGLWLVPALLMAAFYAGYLVHHRYLLDTVLLLSVLAGLGAGCAVDTLASLRKGAFRSVAVYGTVLILLGLNSVVIYSLPKWGPRIRLSHVRAFRSTIEELVGSKGSVLAHPYDRRLADVLIVFTKTKPLFDVDEALAALDSGPVFYVHPETRTHWHKHPFVDLPEYVLRHADQVPVELDGMTHSQVRLASVYYTLYKITPWSERVIEETVSHDHVQGNLMWLDFRQSDPHAVRHVRRIDEEGEVIQEWTFEQGNGMIPFHVNQPVRQHHPHRLIVESSSPLPRNLLVAPTALGGGSYFPVEGARRLSVMDWILRPAHVSNRESRWGGLFQEGAEFVIPEPVGWTDGSYMVSFILQPRWPEAREAVFRYARDGADWMTFTNHFQLGRMYHDLVFTDPGGAPVIPISLETDIAATDTNVVSVQYIGGRILADER